MPKKTISNCLKSAWILPILLLTIEGCQQPESPKSEQTAFWDREDVQELYTATDKRDAAALTPFLALEEDNIRLIAVQQASSLQDSSLAPILMERLNDSDPKIRSAAAYALGLIRSPELMPVLAEAYSAEQDVAVRSELLVAAGRSFTEVQAPLLQQLFLQSNCEEAPVWMLYQTIGQLKTEVTAFTELAMEHLLCTNNEARLAAAHYLSRNRQVNLSSVYQDLIGYFEGETDIEVKIALALSFRNANSPDLQGWLNEALLSEEDERVVINLMRAGSRLEILEESTLLSLMSSEKTGISDQAYTELNKKIESITDPTILTSLLGTSEGEASNASMNAAALVAIQSQNEDAYNRLLEHVSKQDDPYKKARGIQLISSFSEGANYLRLQLDTTLHKAIISTAADALIAMNQSDKLPKGFSFEDVLADMVNTNDPGVLSIVAEFFRATPSMLTEELQKELEYNQSQLILPKEVEAYNAIAMAIGAKTNSEPEVITPTYNHPIPFDLLASYGDTISCTIETSEGNIQLDLYPLQAPGSVASLIELANDGFYENKSFHRVVPSFVIQGGCPRGDGWGSVDYSIRSDFALHSYRSGALGMASAGKDTESCQWFITHSPTPHLEGRYSLFGQVTEGMDIVRKVNVGSTILNVTAK